jgi:hypothetical protein
LQFRAEFKEGLKRNGTVTKVSAIFDSYLKIDPSVQDEIVNVVGKWASLGAAEMVWLSYCVIFCQNKLLQLSARKTLKQKLNEVRSVSQVSEFVEDVKLGLLNFVQNDDVRFLYFFSPW